MLKFKISSPELSDTKVYYISKLTKNYWFYFWLIITYICINSVLKDIKKAYNGQNIDNDN